MELPFHVRLLFFRVVELKLKLQKAELWKMKCLKYFNCELRFSLFERLKYVYELVFYDMRRNSNANDGSRLLLSCRVNRKKRQLSV